MRDLDEAACRAFLGSHRVGVLALADRGAAYAVPLFYAFDGAAIYFHSRPGEKDAFREATGEGCLVVLEVHGDDDWTSVQVRGPVEKVGSNADADRAFKALAENPFPPEFGVDLRGRPERSGKGAYLWRMRPVRVTGRASGSAVRAKR